MLVLWNISHNKQLFVAAFDKFGSNLNVCSNIITPLYVRVKVIMSRSMYLTSQPESVRCNFIKSWEEWYSQWDYRLFVISNWYQNKKEKITVTIIDKCFCMWKIVTTLIIFKFWKSFEKVSPVCRPNELIECIG